MTLAQILTAAASYLGKTTADLTVNSLDLGLLALNQVRTTAELSHDFEFNRKLVTVTIDGVTGGSLDAAVIYGTATAVEPKSILEIGTFDELGNLRPIEWTTVAESLERQYNQVRPVTLRYPTDQEASALVANTRVSLVGRNLFLVPKAVGAQLELGLEVYAMTAEWTSTSGSYAPWTTKGSQFLLWQTVVHLNQLFKEFVPRQEGNLAPPKDLADEGLQALLTWDVMQFEQARRHARG